MTETEVRVLLAEPVPGEAEAAERAWPVIRAAYGARERVPWLERHSRAVLALAAAAAVGVAAATPPGRALVERVREAAGVSPSEPALVRLPAPGRLLVESAQGPWVVRQDGSKRFLGAYEAASWSPRGLFVVATRDRNVVALEPDGDVRWTVTRLGRVADARWAPSGFRIAYREGETLRVVVGDGTNDRLFARRAAPIAPAWLPDAERNVLAYVDAAAGIHVVDVDSGEKLWSRTSNGTVSELAWAADGSRLLVLFREGAGRLYDSRGRKTAGFEGATHAAYSPTGGILAYIAHDQAADTSTVWLVDRGRRQLLFYCPGRLQDLVWSPDGGRLLVTWPGADQWLFFRARAARAPLALSNVGREFDPGGTGMSPFPRVSGWAPVPSG